MTNKEVIDQLRFDMDMILFDGNTGEYRTLEQVKIFNEDNYRTYVADEMAIEALERQEPKNVIQHGAEGYPTCWFECPTCSDYLAGYRKCESINYCESCGQRISWEWEDDEDDE